MDVKNTKLKFDYKNDGKIHVEFHTPRVGNNILMPYPHTFPPFQVMNFMIQQSDTQW